MRTQSIDFSNVRLLDTKMLCEYLSIGRNKALEFGAECGARVKLGGRTLYDKSIIDKAITELVKGGNNDIT